MSRIYETTGLEREWQCVNGTMRPTQSPSFVRSSNPIIEFLRIFLPQRPHTAWFRCQNGRTINRFQDYCVRCAYAAPCSTTIFLRSSRQIPLVRPMAHFSVFKTGELSTGSKITVCGARMRHLVARQYSSDPLDNTPHLSNGPPSRRLEPRS